METPPPVITPHPLQLSPPEIILTILTTLLLFYSVFVSYIITRVIYHGGNLGFDKKHTKYNIKPKNKRDRALGTGVGGTSSTTLLLDSSSLPSNREGNATRNNDEEDEEEDQRIQVLSSFEQDDCGDGSQFPGVKVCSDEPIPLTTLPPRRSETMNEEENAQRVFGLVEPRPHLPFRTDLLKYLTMGLKKLDISGGDWLIVDKEYPAYHSVRSKLLNDCGKECIVYHDPDDEELAEACEELMREVVRFLTAKYPHVFAVEKIGLHKKVVKNLITKEQFALQRPWKLKPLEICARLAAEDFNIIGRIGGGETGQHRLLASATLFPAGWRLRSRIGTSIADLHKPVPQWKDIPDILNLSYFSRIEASSAMQRNTFFIQVNADNGPTISPLLLFIQKGKDFFPGSMANLRPENIIVRHERQTFRRLKKSGVIVFTVKTSMQRLVDVPVEERQGLVKEIYAWDEDIARYKGRDLWAGLSSVGVMEVAVLGLRMWI